jgi:hypothetical protein
MNQLELQRKIETICGLLIERKGFISSIDFLLELKYLTKENYDLWRNGKCQYLEQVCNTNLSRLTLINTTIKKVANELKLQRSWTAYQRFGKGPAIRLRFGKSGDKRIEEQYATHYLDKQRILEIKEGRQIL